MNTGAKPYFSIIMAAYNAESFIEEALMSVINQTYKNWELICVDDGSTDRTSDIVEDFRDKHQNIILIKQQNKGNYATTEHAAKIARGVYICMLDSDDKFSEDYLQQMYQAAITNPDADALVPDLCMWYENDESKTWYWNHKHNIKAGTVITGREAFLRTFPWSIIGCGAWKNTVYHNVPFNKLNTSDANECRTRELFLGCDTIVFCKGTYIYRKHPDSLSTKLSSKTFESLITNLELEKLLYSSNIPTCEIHRIRITFLESMVRKTILFYTRYAVLAKEEKVYIKQIIKKVYKSFDYTNLFTSNNLKNIVIKNTICSGYNRFVFCIICSVVVNKISRKIFGRSIYKILKFHSLGDDHLVR